MLIIFYKNRLHRAQSTNQCRADRHINHNPHNVVGDSDKGAGSKRRVDIDTLKSQRHKGAKY